MRHSSLKIALISVSGLTLLALLTIAYLSRSVISYKLEGKDPASLSVAEAQVLADLDSSDSQALRRLAQDEFERGEYQSASQNWSRISSLEPLEAEPIYQQARSLFMSGDIERAEHVVSDKRLANYLPAQLLEVRLLMGRGELESARKKVDLLAQTYAGNEDLALMLADLAIARSDLESAGRVYAELEQSERSEISAAARIGSAQILLSDNRTQDAVQKLAALKAESLEAGAAEVLARLYLKAGEVDKALKVFETLISRFGARSAWVVEIAEQRIARGELQVINELRSLMTEVNLEAISARYYLDSLSAYLAANCKTFLDQNSWASAHVNRPLSLWLRIDCASKIGDLEQFKAAAEVAGLESLDAKLRNRLYVTLLQRALPAINRGEGEFARQLTVTAQRLKRPHIEADIMLARAHLLLQNNSDAESLVTPLLAIKEHRVGALEILVRAQIAGGTFAQAELNVVKLIDSAPTTGLGQYWAGVLHEKQDNSAAAEVQYRRAFELNYKDKAGVALMGLLLAQSRWDEVVEIAEWYSSTEDPIRQSVGSTYAAAAAAGKEEYLNAALRYVEAVELTPDRIPYYLRAADNFILAKAYDQAESILIRAEQRSPKNRYVEFKLAYCAEQSGDLSLAQERYRRLILSEPQWALPMHNLAGILAQEEDRLDEAFKLSTTAYRLNPNWKAAAEQYESLKLAINQKLKPLTSDTGS